MKKITITTEEEINFNDLSEREKAIYEAGESNGFTNAGCVAIGIAIGILLIVFITEHL